jgi:hypothetical protein
MVLVCILFSSLKKNDHRVSRGVKSVINEAASLPVMVDNIDNRDPQYREIQAEQFLQRIGGEASLCLPGQKLGNGVAASRKEDTLENTQMHSDDTEY